MTRPREIRSVLGAPRGRARVARRGRRPRLEPPHAKWFVGGKLNVSVNCLDRHVARPAPQQGRDHLGRRARRSADADLFRSASAGLDVRQRAQVARREEGRSRRDLHAARARAGDRDAGLRAHRRRAQRRVRRLQRRVAARSHQRRAGWLLITADGGYRRGNIVPPEGRSPTRPRRDARRSSTSSCSSAAAASRSRSR